MSSSDFNAELLSAYLDGEVTDAERAQVEARLADDPAAAELLAELRGASESIRALPRDTVDGNFTADVLAALDGDSAAAAAASITPASRTESFWQRPGVRRGVGWACLAAAASFMLVVFQPPGEDAGEPRVAQAPARSNESQPAADAADAEENVDEKIAADEPPQLMAAAESRPDAAVEAPASAPSPADSYFQDTDKGRIAEQAPQLGRSLEPAAPPVRAFGGAGAGAGGSNRGYAGGDLADAAPQPGRAVADAPSPTQNETARAQSTAKTRSPAERSAGRAADAPGEPAVVVHRFALTGDAESAQVALQNALVEAGIQLRDADTLAEEQAIADQALLAGRAGVEELRRGRSSVESLDNDVSADGGGTEPAAVEREADDADKDAETAGTLDTAAPPAARRYLVAVPAERLDALLASVRRSVTRGAAPPLPSPVGEVADDVASAEGSGQQKGERFAPSTAAPQQIVGWAVALPDSRTLSTEAATASESAPLTQYRDSAVRGDPRELVRILLVLEPAAESPPPAAGAPGDDESP